MPFHYLAFGWVVSSEIALSALPDTRGPADVYVRRGSTPARLPRERGHGVCYSAAPGEALVWIDGVCRLHVRHGTEIIVDAAPGVDTATLQLFVLNLAFGLLFLQRGDLVLHAAVVESEGQSVALAGASSAGKSTVAAALHARGYRVLTDELCIIRDQPGLGPCVVPGPPHLQVWADALPHLGRDAGALAPVRPGLRKYLLPLAAGYADTPLPLKAVYVLRPWVTEEVAVVPLTGAHQFEAIAQHTYHFEYVSPTGHAAAHFDRVSRLRMVPTARVHYPQCWSSMDALIDRLALGAPPDGIRQGA